MKRYLINKLFKLLCYLTVLSVLLCLFNILSYLISLGLPALTMRTVMQQTASPNEGGGLANAILGSLLISGAAILIAIPWGVAVATFLVEEGNKTRKAKLIRYLNDLFLSTPSILIGLFVYSLWVVPHQSFSASAGIMALTFIALPIVIRTSEDVLYLVSPMLKESALALGIPKYRVFFSIVYKVSLSGLFTGFILSFARILGETAPLLLTTLNNPDFSFDLSGPIATLPVVIYQYALSPYEHWQTLAWAGALLITLFILILNIISRVAIQRKAAH